MTTFDGAAGQWHVITADGAEDVIRVPWPGGEITERREVRREIVALYDAACARLGVVQVVGGQQLRAHVVVLLCGHRHGGQATPAARAEQGEGAAE